MSIQRTLVTRLKGEDHGEIEQRWGPFVCPISRPYLDVYIFGGVFSSSPSSREGSVDLSRQGRYHTHMETQAPCLKRSDISECV